MNTMLLRTAPGLMLLLGLVALATTAAASPRMFATGYAASDVTAIESVTIAGRISDAETGLPLPGASVWIDGTSLGSATDRDGRYRISNVPEGEQIVVVSFIGYNTARVSVTVRSGEVLEQNITMTVDVVEGGEVLITAQAEGQVAAINQQLSSNTIVNVVSSARIQELPDANAAESVGRLPGVSIVRNAGEGQKVVIRGLSPKFNNVTVNNQRIPSTDFNDRSTDLSMIASDMLSGIEIVKSMTPDRDADMIGGTVNFQLMDAPEGVRSDVRLQSGYSSQGKSIGFYKGSLSLSRRFFSSRLGVIGQANLEQADRGSDVFSAGYARDNVTLAEGEAQRMRIGNLNLSDRAEVRHRYGGSVILDYQLPAGRLRFSNFISRLNRDETLWNKNYALGGRSVQFGIRDRDIDVTVLSNTMQGDYRLLGSDVDWSLAHSRAHHERPYDNSFTFSEVAAFEGELDLTKGPDLIPQSAKNRLDETYLEWGDHFFVENMERDLSAALNVRTPFAFGRKITGYTKIGGKYRGIQRTNDETRWYLAYYYGDGPNFVRSAYPDAQFKSTSQGHLAVTNFLDDAHDLDGFLDGQYELNAAIDRDAMADVYDRVGGRYYKTPFADMADFEMKEEISAGYAMMELNLGRRLMILPGIRYEHTQTRYDAKMGEADNIRSEIGFFSDTSSAQSFGQWFPVVHVRLRFTDWLDLRLARTRTLSRPDYTQYSPRQRIRSGSALAVDRGNPALRPASALNYDALLSVYANRLGLLTFGGFYKEIDDVIYVREKTVLDPLAEGLPAYTRGSRLTEPVNNAFRTTLKGLEVEWQTHFTYLPGLFSGLVLSVNYARILSDTRYPRTILKRDPTPPFRQTSIDTFRVGRMIDQPAHIANLSIGYDRRGFSGRISMLYQESSLSGVGDFPEEDSFTNAYLRWDAMVQQKIGGHFSVYVNVNNIGDRPDISSIGIGFPTTQEYYGWTADLGVRYRY